MHICRPQLWVNTKYEDAEVKVQMEVEIRDVNSEKLIGRKKVEREEEKTKQTELQLLLFLKSVILFSSRVREKIKLGLSNSRLGTCKSGKAMRLPVKFPEISSHLNFQLNSVWRNNIVD